MVECPEAQLLSIMTEYLRLSNGMGIEQARNLAQVRIDALKRTTLSTIDGKGE